MNKRVLHIVYGFTGKALLHQSQFINSVDGDILELSDPLSEGPLYNLDDRQSTERRKQWVDNVFGRYESETGLHFVEETLVKLQMLLDSAQNYEAIYLWLGEVAKEKITTARVLYHLRKSSIPIYQVDFSKATFVNAVEKTVVPKSLNVLSAENINTIGWCFEEISESEKQRFVLLWKQLLADDAVFRIFNKEGVCIMGDATFYDRYLLNRCSKQPQLSSRIVGYTLMDIWDEFGLGEGAGDSYLYYRLNILGEMGKVEISDRADHPESNRRIFNVSLL